MTSLQLGLVVAGVVLVIGVLVYNWLQERRVRRRMDAAFSGAASRADVLHRRESAKDADARVEPTLGAAGATAPRGGDAHADDDTAPFQVPLRAHAASDRDASDLSDADDALDEDGARAVTAEPDAPAAATVTERVVHVDGHGAQPDPEIECIVALQPVKPVPVGTLAPVLNARLGKRLRWFGRRGPGMPWQRLAADTSGEFAELLACLLLADRTGAASVPMLEAFTRLLADVAPSLPATFVAPDLQREAARAETLDRMCADLDVQIGLTVLKPGQATIAGTRLRGVAEAAGFRLAGGRFEWVQEETGAVLYALHNFKSEPFTPDNLRAMATPGVVFLLDVPRVSDPVRVFDQMKLAARRMTQTLDAQLVDDNRRPIDDPALAKIRTEIQSAAEALARINVAPGSPRALALFGG